MPFDGSGNFNRVMNWVNDALAGIKVKSDRHDQEDDNFAAGLSNCITKDGQTQPTGNIPMNGQKLVNLGAPTSPTDAATKGYADAKVDFTTGITLPGSGGGASIRFADADIGFGTRRVDTPTPGTLNRFVWNDKPDLSGADIATMTDVGDFSLTGMFNCDRVMGNTFYDRVTPAWKTVAAGFIMQMDFDPATGNTLWYSSTATAAAGAAAALSQNMTLAPTGALTARGRVSGSDVLSQGNVYTGSGSAYLGTDGNILGSLWSGWGANDAYSAISARIESRAQAWAINYANGCVQSMRVAGYVEYQPTAGDGGATYSGYYVVMARRVSSDRYFFGFRQLQMYIPSQGWLQATGW